MANLTSNEVRVFSTLDFDVVDGAVITGCNSSYNAERTDSSPIRMIRHVFDDLNAVVFSDVFGAMETARGNRRHER